MEYPQVFDIVKFQKEKALPRFNHFREISNFRRILEVAVVLGLISWYTAGVPAVAKAAVGHVVMFSAYLFNHHVVFLIGNAIIALLFVLCRRNDDVSSSDAVVGEGNLYAEYVRHRGMAHRPDLTLPPTPEKSCGSLAEKDGGGGDEEKQMVVCVEEKTVGIPQCDDVAVAIQKATRQINRFQRTQSEKLRREMRTKPRTDLRRSESQLSLKTIRSGEKFRAAGMERLSSEEFRRTVDAFIDKHWSKNKKYQLLKMV